MIPEIDPVVLLAGCQSRSSKSVSEVNSVLRALGTGAFHAAIEAIAAFLCFAQAILKSRRLGVELPATVYSALVALKTVDFVELFPTRNGARGQTIKSRHLLTSCRVSSELVQ